MQIMACKISLLAIAQLVVPVTCMKPRDGYSMLLNADVKNFIYNQLKKGKAAGAENITSEHIIYADPVIAYHLCNLLNLIVQHGYMPDQLGSGIVIPLMKDRLGDATKLDNYRGITDHHTVLCYLKNLRVLR